MTINGDQSGEMVTVTDFQSLVCQMIRGAVLNNLRNNLSRIGSTSRSASRALTIPGQIVLSRQVRSRHGGAAAQ